MDELVTITTCASPWDAHVLRGRLKAEGIPDFVVHENIHNTPLILGIAIQVPAIDAKRALEIFREGESATLEDD